jgi:hypothetical protein
LNFLDKFSKNTPVLSLIIIVRPVRRKSFHAEDRRIKGLTDRQTDMTRLVVAFLNFANAPKNQTEGNIIIGMVVVVVVVVVVVAD